MSSIKNEQVKRLLKLLCCTILPAVLISGCWNMKEINDIAIVSGLGIDQLPDEDGYRVTFQVVVPSKVTQNKGGGEGGSPSPAVAIYSEKGKTLFDTIRKTAKKVPRQLFFSHLRIIVFGESFAKGGIGEVLDFMERDQEMRPLTKVFVAKGVDAKKVLTLKNSFENIPANAPESQVQLSEERSGYHIDVNLDNLIRALVSEGKEPVISGLKMQKNGMMEIDGISFFKGDKLIGWLENDQARGLLWIQEKVKTAIVVIKCKDKTNGVSIEVIRSKSKLTAHLKEAKPVIHVLVRTEASVGGADCSIDLTKYDEILRLQAELAIEIEKEINMSIKAAQSKRSDIFGFGVVIQRFFPNEWSKWKKDWDSSFSELEVHVNVDAFIRRSGLYNKPFKNK